MTLEDLWPLFGLTLTTPRLILRPVRDEDLPGLAQAALDGIHDPAVMPFGRPWTDAPPSEMPRRLAEYQWQLRSGVRPDHWNVAFGVHFDGRVVGVQDLGARDFANRQTVNTGSWLTQRVQGIGLGTEMRAALLMFAFDVLDARWAESGAASWNAPSLAVSEKLGYERNGVSRVISRAGHPEDELRVRLERAAFIRPDWGLDVQGAAPVLRQLGLTAS